MKRARAPIGALLVLFVCNATSRAVAEEPFTDGPGQPRPSPGHEPRSPKSPPSPAPPDLGFDLLAPPPPTSPATAAANAALDGKVRLRRRMLTAHQAIGFVTLAALAATCVVGQLNYYDKYMSGDFNEQYARPHLWLGIGTTALFAVTGLLAVAAPNPYPKEVKFDTALVHKISMAIATAGMVAQMVMGPITSYRVGHSDQQDWALAHLVTGWATFGFMALGVVTYVF